MKFEWDLKKNEINIRERGIDFADAHEIFNNDLWIFPDNRRNYGEERYIGIGHIRERLMVIVYTERNLDIIKVISLRKANKREQEKFRSSIQN